MNTCTSPCPRTSLALFLAPHEPICFTSCDGPHSGVADDKRPPHREDILPIHWIRPALGARADHTADNWRSYGFTAADLAHWHRAGIYEPAVAAECRTAGFDPSQEADRRFLLSDDPETARPWCDLLNDSDTTAAQAMAAWKAAP